MKIHIHKKMHYYSAIFLRILHYYSAIFSIFAKKLHDGHINSFLYGEFAEAGELRLPPLFVWAA